jgi:hypothetical protein
MSDSGSGRRYDIVIRGRLSNRYQRAFDGVTLEPRRGETRLHAELADQAQLYGLLNRLRDFGIELVSVNAVSRPPDVT